MYSLDINFIKGREPTTREYAAPGPQRSSGLQLPIILGIAAFLLFPGLVGGAWLFFNWQTNQLRQRSADLDAELTIVSQKENKIKELQAGIEQANVESQSLASVFNLVKPWSAIFQDISERIPESIQIRSIQQSDLEVEANQAAQAVEEGTAQPSRVPKVQLTINGFGRSFSDVNDFLLLLQQSNFLNEEETFIANARLVDQPGEIVTAEDESVQKEVEPEKVVSYTIQTQLNEVPANELLSELDQKGAVGLAERIKALKKEGVIEP